MKANRKSLKAAKLAQDVKRAIAEVGLGPQRAGRTVLGAVRAEITHAAQVRWDALINRRDVYPSIPTAAPPSNEPVYDTEAAPIQHNHVSLDDDSKHWTDEPDIPEIERRIDALGLTFGDAE